MKNFQRRFVNTVKLINIQNYILLPVILIDSARHIVIRFQMALFL